MSASLLKASRLLLASTLLPITLFSALAEKPSPASPGFQLIQNDAGVPIYAPAGKEYDAVVNDLASHLEKITGKQFPVQRGAAEGKTAAISLSLWDAEAAKKANAVGGFALQVTPQQISIKGTSAGELAYGVSELLEQLGVRWFLPGPIGTVIPKETAPSVKAQKIAQSPSFQSRHYQGVSDKDWHRRVRMGGEAFNGAHGIRIPKGVTLKTDPELFALVKGERKASQMCVTNPKLLEYAVEEARKFFKKNPNATIYGLGPNDGAGFCECADCVALDSGEWDSFSGEHSVTDRYIWFFNKVLEELHKTNPGKKIGFYAYHSYMLPPKKVKPNPSIVAALAPIALCRVHGMNNPICPDRSYYKTLLQAWTEILPEVYERGYWFNLADPGVPFISVHRMRDEIPQAKELGVKGWRSECSNSWVTELPSLYVGSKLMWDTKVDVDGVLEDFYQKFFGPAQAPMKLYYETIDTALRDSDHHAGGATSTPQRYPEAVRAKLAKALEEAKKLAPEEPYKTRVAVIDESFQFLQNFVEMLEHRNQFDWTAAQKNLDALDALHEKMASYDPPLINKTYPKSYLKRFFRRTVEDGYARSRDGNEVIATFGKNWEMFVDTNQVGETIGLFKKGVKGGNWQKTNPYETTWSDIGLHYYRGLVWYRQNVDIDAKWKGKRLFIWFGGVDDTARVWLNGKEVGISPGAAFYPFELDVTDQIIPGEKNELVVCVANLRTNEIGTGGITAPVMIYAPKEGDKAELKNERPLRETFP